MARPLFSGCLLVLVLGHVSTLPVHVVHSHWGTIEGVTKTSSTGKHYITYFGIPYAKPPVGDLRFKDPVPHPSPQGIFKTSGEFGAMCAQPPDPGYPFQLPPQDEDCLTLNVFTPEKASHTSRAVIVWIHGGAWIRGGANFYNIVTDADVIGVSIQYRLGIFGFLSTGSKAARGNYAMLDQVLALKWVKDNIASFGGDVNNITLYGQSAGAASVSFHTLSPLSKGLFNRAIMQSGTAPGYWTSRRDASKYVYQMAKNMNCPVPLSELPDDQADLKMLDCMRKLPYRTVIDKSQLDLGITEFSMDIILSVVPDNNFLMGDPSQLIQDKQFLQSVGFYDYDIMIGINNAEGGYALGQAYQYGLEHNVSSLEIFSDPTYYTQDALPTLLKRVYGQVLNVDIDVLQYQSLDYKDHQPPYPLYNHTAVSVLELVTNIAFVVPTYQALRAHSAHSSSGRTYLYYFDHYPSFLKDSFITGMPHGLDIEYSFGIHEAYLRVAYNFSEPIAQEEYDLSDTFVQLLADFAKKGDPNPALRNHLSTTWLDFSEPDESYLTMTTNMAVKQHLRRRAADVWLDLIPKLNKDMRRDCNIAIQKIPKCNPVYYYVLKWSVTLQRHH